jgi:PKD repeat protein
LSTDSTSVDASAPTSTKSTGSASHTYGKAGTYLIKVTVTDSAGQKGFATKKLVVK